MLAIRAFPALVPPSPASETPRHPILASIMPALDTAFGLEPAVLFPPEIAAWVARLTAVLDAVEAYAEVEFLEAA
ncbi:hypothetical protein [Methylobacterium aerolatum]|uniref:Uncharacterized protein n=1 Tax=Methylobacterium aerolatum TaxID=418708 RepID=A0ABU0HWT2_9HYPH|nr:hypothetical protein [Methylobacterium aerolatum]MDQ0446798.1 hypothetical protein [Methylobacterium aerolatum]GJD33764.1 hypothetical protein FMGBMHLM_0657 [Methylobacterium aerolatum]